MTRSFLHSFFVLFFFVSFTIEAKSQNLVVNGDLESWTAGVPDGWGPLIESISQETTIIHGGNSSAKHTSSTTSQKFNQNLTGITPGQEYTISYWYYDNDPTAKTRIWSYWLSGASTLPDNADILRPSDYSTDNPSWQNFNVLLSAPAGADGFRFEVRVYQENGNGGGVYYDDFSFSGDVIIYPEPTNYPTNFSASLAGLTINLTWTDAVGAQLPSGYIIMAGIDPSLPIPSDGEPVADDTDLSDGTGALNVDFGMEMASFGGLESNTTYYFTIYPYTNSGTNIDFKTNGTAPSANETTSNIATIESENFDVSWGNWTTISVTGDQVWDRNNNYGINNTPCARMSGYSGGAFDNDDWLISPGLNFDDYDNETIEFYTAMNYTGDPLLCKISTDYDGGGDPYSASWTTLAYTPSPGSWTWTSSGILDISSYSGTVYIAFQYTSNTTEAATWEVDNIIITGEEGGTIDPEPSNYPTDFSATATGTIIDIAWTDAVGTQLPDKYILYAGITSALPVPVDGIPIANDPDLSDGSAVMNISYGIEEASFSDLVPATTYYFKIFPYTNSGVNINYKTDGTAPTTDATTQNIVVVTIESENFNEDWGNWTTISVIGDQVWSRDNNYGIGETPCALMSGYSGSALDNEDWLISPELNLNNYINEIITFQNAKNYNGNDLELKVSTNYDGSSDPNSATWTDLTYTKSPGTWSWTFSGEVDLSGYNGVAVYVAFKYTSTTMASATWEIDDIEITGEEEATIYPEPSNYPTSFSADATGTSILVSWTDATGTQLPHHYLIYAGTSATLPIPVDGTPVADDLDLTDGSGALNVDFGIQEALFSGLLPGVTYHFVIYPYTNTGNNSDYKTDGIAPAANATASLIPEPANYPADFSAIATSNSVNLTWSDPTGGQLPEMYIIFAGTSASLPVPVDGTPVADDTDLSDGAGVLNIAFGIEQASFVGLPSNVTYHFSIYPYTNNGSSIDYKTDGTAPVAQASTYEPVLVTIETENFDANWGAWTTISVLGEQVWDRNNNFGTNDTPCARMSGYSSGYVQNDDWLISPALNFDDYTSEMITFQNAKSYTGNDLELKISTDYDGGGDPYSATWTALSYTMSSGSFEWTFSGEVDLSGFSGNAVYVAFHYTCTTSASATWEVDDIEISGEENQTIDPEPSSYPTNFQAAPNGSAIEITWTDATGAQLPDRYILFAGLNSDLPVPVDGTPVQNDPDLTDGSAVLNINFGTESASFSNLPSTTTYYFVIYPYTNSGVNINYKTDGTPPSDDATTPNIVVVTLEEENFDESWGGWTRISVTGSQVWDRDNNYGIEDTPCASMSGYEGAPFENDDWLISPVLDLDNYINEILTFQNAKKYAGNDLVLKVSTDYDGGSDPYTANWTSLPFTMSPGNFEWTPSGEIDLSGFNGSAVYVAFHFTSTSTASATWEVDDIEIMGEEDLSATSYLSPDNLFRIYPNPSNGTVNFEQTGGEFDKGFIMTVSGSLIREFSLDGTTNQFDFSELDNGIYLIRITNGKSGLTIYKKLILN